MVLYVATLSCLMLLNIFFNRLTSGEPCRREAKALENRRGNVPCQMRTMPVMCASFFCRFHHFESSSKQYLNRESFSPHFLLNFFYNMRVDFLLDIPA